MHIKKLKQTKEQIIMLIDRLRRIPLIYWNLAGFIGGCIAGLLIYDSSCAKDVIDVLAPFGGILINMLKMIVIPIIFFSLIYGSASLPTSTFGKMGMAVFFWYLGTSIYAAIFGTAGAFLFDPDMQITGVSADLLTQAKSMQSSSSQMGNPFVNLLYSLFANPFKSLAEGNFLPVIVFSIMFGLAARIVMDTTKDEQTVKGVQMLLNVIDACQKAVAKIIEWIMIYFPVGIFALTCCCFATFGSGLFKSYVQVAGCVIVCIMIMLFICYPLFIFLLCRVNPYPILWKLREPILTAFVTRSSAATLPVSLRTSLEKLKVRRELSSFTLSLGATVNMDGVCIHLPVFTVLAANMFGIDLTISQILLMVLCIVFASIGAGGVPGGSIFLLFMVLENLHLTPEQTGIIVALALGINPILDMFETACNVAGDNIGTFIVGKRLKMLNK